MSNHITILVAKRIGHRRYNEGGLLGEIEEHLKITIEQTSTKMEIPVDDFDGKVNIL